MNSFGSTLFNASPFIRWTISPFVFLTMVVLPLTIPSFTPKAVLSMTVLELIGMFLLLSMWTKGKIQKIAFRIVTGFVVIVYASYLIYEFFYSGHSLNDTGSSSEASPKNSLLGFIIIGLPCLWFTIFGRFTLSPAPEIIKTDSDCNPFEDERKKG